jgi:hypothetical protein
MAKPGRRREIRYNLEIRMNGRPDLMPTDRELVRVADVLCPVNAPKVVIPVFLILIAGNAA